MNDLLGNENFYCAYCTRIQSGEILEVRQLHKEVLKIYRCDNCGNVSTRKAPD